MKGILLVTAGSSLFAPKALFDQRIISALIDLAGYLEAGLERIAIMTRRAPFASLSTSIILGFILARRLRAITAPPRQWPVSE